MKHKGFTIVEVLITLVVIAILAGIGFVSYSFIQQDAMDGKIRSTVKDVGDAMSLYASDNGGLPGAQGHFQQANGVRRLMPKYLKEDYNSGLKSKHASHPGNILRWYKCNALGEEGDFVIYATLNNPSDDDKTNFMKIRNECQHSDTHAPTSGQTQYNYARRF